MFNKNIKLVLAAGIIALAVWEFVEGNIGNGIMFLLLAGIFIFLYFKNEIILLAFLKLMAKAIPVIYSHTGFRLTSYGYVKHGNGYNDAK